MIHLEHRNILIEERSNLLLALQLFLPEEINLPSTGSRYYMSCNLFTDQA